MKGVIAKTEWYGDKFLKQVEIQAKRAVLATALYCEGVSVLLCPVDSGNLRGSITHSLSQDQLTAYIGTNVLYAPYIEFGTILRRPQSFLRPAIDNNKLRITGIFVVELRKAIKGYGR